MFDKNLGSDLSNMMDLKMLMIFLEQATLNGVACFSSVR